MGKLKSLDISLEPSRFYLPPWTTFLIGGFFLLISFSSNHYWDEYFYIYSVHSFSFSELLEMEPDLGKGLFPQAYFSFKYAFVAFLYFLDSIFPGGKFSLAVIQFIFALLVLVFAGSSYLLLRRIFSKNHAHLIAITLLFLPLSTYLSYKILSEIFSLIWVTLGSWLYLYSFSVEKRKGYTLVLIGCVLLILLAVLSRFTTIIFFGAMVVALFLVGDNRYPRSKLFASSALVVTLVAILTVLCYRFFIGLSISEILALLGAVTVRSHGIAIKIYATFMVVQTFIFALLALIKRLLNYEIIFSIIWASICSLPFIFLSDYVEPRYFYMAIVPLAILCCSGILILTRWFEQTTLLTRILPGTGYSFFIILFTLVVGNKLLFAHLMPYELNQKKYNELISKIEDESSTPTFLVPWISDFCFLKYIFPHKNIHLTWSSKHGQYHDFFHLPMFIKWAGGEDYVGSKEKFDRLSQPILYVGWRYNQPALEIKKKMMWLKNRYIDSVEVREGLKNHLEESWMWKSPELTFTPHISVEPYESFLVSPKIKE